MNWADTALALLSAILALAIASLLVRRPSQRRGTYALVLLIAFVILQSLGRAYLFPRLNAWGNVREAKSLPGLAPLRHADPKAYADTLAFVRGALDRAVDRGTIEALVSGHLGPLAQRRLPVTSNQAAMGYLNVVLAAMQASRASDAPGPVTCYGILDPARLRVAAGQIPVPAALLGRTLAAQVAVIAAAARDSQPVPDESAVAPVLRPIDARLRRSVGSDALSLRFPELPPFQEARACTIDARLFAALSRLPASEGGPAVRFLWSRVRRE